ncbi:C40 family peptidase [Propionibacterium sp.]|uniref:C40 family peptidase n=1 Tax=Propionibacterium sp. TaxID=1977903 RepID=UPI0039ED4351
MEAATPRRALMASLSESAVLNLDHGAPRRVLDDAQPGAAFRSRAPHVKSRRNRFVFPAAAVLISSAIGLGATLAPQASASPDRPANTSSVAAVSPASTAGSVADVMDSSVADVNQATSARLAGESAQLAQQASQDDQRTASLASVGKAAVGQVNAEKAAKAAADQAAADAAAAAKSAADKAAADKAAADKAAADAAAQAATQTSSAATQTYQAQRAATSQTASQTTTSSASTPARAASTASTASSSASAKSAGTSSSAAQTALNFALSQVGKAYATGGTGPSAYDCSGLMYTAYANAGISLPRTSYAQASAGTSVSQSNLQPGDLVFFYDNGHVGMYIGNGQVVHAADYGIGVVVGAVSSMSFSGAVRVA